MKKVFSVCLSILLTFVCAGSVSCQALADGGEAGDYTYQFTSIVHYSKNDSDHNGDTYHMEVWTDDPEKGIDDKVKVESVNIPNPKCGTQYQWTITIPYEIKMLYVKFYYQNSLKETVTIDHPTVNVALDPVYLFESFTPVEPSKPLKPGTPAPDRNWKKINGRWYFYNNNNELLKGVWSIDGVWYCFDKKDGHMLTGWQKEGNSWFYFSSKGPMLTGWQRIGGKWYLLDTKSGAMKTGWQKNGGKWYYLNSSGAMVTGWQKIGGKWYLFNSSGAMLSGWQRSGGSWYYCNSSGAMLTGWQKIGGKWYYFNTSGAMRTASLKQGGKTYYFNSAGACTNP